MNVSGEGFEPIEDEPEAAQVILGDWCDRMGLRGCSAARRVTMGRLEPGELVRALHIGLADLPDPEAESEPGLEGGDEQHPLPKSIQLRSLGGLVPERAARSIHDRYLATLCELDEVYDRLTRAMGCGSRPLNPDVLVDRVEGVISEAQSEARRQRETRERKKRRQRTTEDAA